MSAATDDTSETPRLDTPSRGVVEGPPRLPARPPTAELTIILPGEPHAQMRARSRSVKTKAGREFIQHYDDPKSREWKRDAQVYYRAAMIRAGIGASAPAFTGHVDMLVSAVFALPKSKHRKRTPVPRRIYEGAKDGDNVLKAVMDAGNGLLWADDHQVKHFNVWLWTGAQGEAPHIQIRLRALDPDGNLTALRSAPSKPLQLAVGGS